MDVFDSVYSNNILALREYLETGDVNVVNERGMSLLHYSIVFNNMTIFNILLDNYIDINIKDNHGDTAAHICVINNRIGFLKMLIRNNCDLTLKNDDGHTPLYKACMLGRENMVELQREMAKNYDVVMEGRDITTVVLPNANYKFYLDATLEERANRRYKQYQEKGIDMTLEEIKENISKRDYNDMHKEVGSLIRTDEQVYIDSTNLTIEEVVNKMIEIIEE